ncbi:hypothetical protein J3S85_00700 [Streptomyces lavenduligriseus]|nr:hypothetical protein J3S85_00700 [Streptomyces lavenduligriseus]
MFETGPSRWEARATGLLSDAGTAERVGGGGREQQLILLRRLGVVGHDCRRGYWGAGQDPGARREARADVVHGHGERGGLGEHRLDGLRQENVVDRLA